MARNLSRRRRVVEDDEYDDRDKRRDEDEEEPRRGRSRRRSAQPDDGPDEDEPPRRSRSSRSRDEDDEAPRSRRPRREDRDEEDEPPRGRSSRRARDDDDEDRGRGRGRGRRDRDDDGDRASRKAVSTTAGSGWAGYQEVKTSGGDFADEFKTEPDTETLIKILDAEPFYTYRQHWLNELSGRKSFVCLGEDCPLCDIGDKPSGFACFNVVDFTNPDKPKTKVWKCGTKNTGVLENYAKDPKTGPLDRDDLYFAVLRTGSKSKGWQTTIRPVKARDVEEDWDIDPLTGEEIDEFFEKGFEAEQVITVSTRRELKEIARSLD